MPGIYIHIPFCRKKCFYCDFYTQIPKNQEIIDQYFNALFKEIQLRENFLTKKRIHSIFLGGGTPSFVKTQLIEKLFNNLAKIYNWSKYVEITLEANPEDLTKEYIKNIKNYTPINRISIGVQSFLDKNLKFLGRNHTAKTAITAVENTKKYFQNISIDLIFGYSEQNIKNLKYDLETFLKLNIPHISTYSLIIEKGSIFYILTQKKQKKFETSEENYVKMYKTLTQILKQNGYIHYEISNFAKKGFISVHNWNYWSGGEYLGLGAAAHSYDKNFRYWNIANYIKYIQLISKNILPISKEKLSEIDKFNEYILTRLRTYKGLNINELKQKFPQFTASLTPKLHYLIENQLIIKKNNSFLPTLKGYMLNDFIIKTLIIA